MPRLELEDQEMERQRQMQAADDVLAAGSPRVGNSMELHHQQQQTPTSGFGNFLSALSNYDRVQPNSGGNQQSVDGNTGWGVDADEIGQDRPVMLHGAAGLIRGNPHMHNHAPIDGAGQPYAALEDAADRICAEPGPAGGAISYNWPSAWEEGTQELTDHAHQVWDDIAYNGDIHFLEKIMLICELPFTFLRKVRLVYVLLHTDFFFTNRYWINSFNHSRFDHE